MSKTLKPKGFLHKKHAGKRFLWFSPSSQIRVYVSFLIFWTNQVRFLIPRSKIADFNTWMGIPTHH
jgi:hypothetical protein